MCLLRSPDQLIKTLIGSLALSVLVSAFLISLNAYREKVREKSVKCRSYGAGYTNVFKILKGK